MSNEQIIKNALNGIFMGLNEELVAKLPIELIAKLEDAWSIEMEHDHSNAPICDVYFSEAILRIFFAKENDFVKSLKNQIMKWITESNPKYNCPLSPKQIGCAGKIYLPKGLHTHQLSPVQKQHATLVNGIHYL